jgi:hypothetical protein
MQKAETIAQASGAQRGRRAPLKVAIVGFGTVGRSVAKVLSSGIHPSLQLSAICNRDVERKKVDWVPARCTGPTAWMPSSGRTRTSLSR